MSYFSNTLFPIVEGVFESSRDLPSDPSLAAEAILAAGYPREASYIRGLSGPDLQNVYAWSGLVSKADEVAS